MRVVASTDREAQDDALFEVFRAHLSAHSPGLVGFATGETYAGFFERIARAVRDGALDLSDLRATHLDEYWGFPPSRHGGMVHELTTRCPPLADLLATGRFLPVPSDGGPAALAEHERRIAALGGVALQFLGLGRNGHIAFNEPGTPFEAGFHRVALASETRVDALARFDPDEPPTAAVTAGPASILAARRIVVAAAGAEKAEAVREMLEGPVDPICPASVLRRHFDCVAYLDEEAAERVALREGAGTGGFWFSGGR